MPKSGEQLDHIHPFLAAAKKLITVSITLGTYAATRSFLTNPILFKKDEILKTFSRSSLQVTDSFRPFSFNE